MRGRRFAAVPIEVAAAAVQIRETSQQWRFSPEQLDVLERLLTGGNGIEAVVGVAGAGKTSLMAAARTGWEAQELVVASASTASVAAENLFNEAAIPSHSIASWLARIDRGQGLAGVDVLVVDEAAMVDDRAMARLVVEAARTGTKVVSIGDPEQLRAIGVGGMFAEVHRLTHGLTLGENRRQVDAAERDALQTWRDGDRRGALRALAAAGHVHATDSPAQAHEQMLTAWAQARADIPDPHDRIDDVLLLAGRNADVDMLNAGARAQARAGGELVGDDVDYGPGIALAVGDVVRVRANDYRSRRGAGADVLNGYRAVVTEQDPELGARIAWRAPGPDGPELTQAWMSPSAIAEGELTHGYAMTIASAQGLTSDVALVYAAGADAYTIYPGITRARRRTDTWLPLDALEDDTTRIRLGPVADRAERLDRAVTAYADRVERARGLREEASIRAALPADRLAAEDAIRVDIERDRREQRARERRQEQQLQQTRRPRLPAHQGPGHGGRGFSM
ncbi:AAA family ATPase [Embleya sp. NPDC127516]|uniref:AAA family ATPase n=1 Tax=Embleya sp. NPDC127516 TaxID=3363990 RepID=UPI003812EE47